MMVGEVTAEALSAAINLEVSRKQRLLGDAREGGGNFLLLLRRRRTYIQHVHFDLRLRRLLRSRQQTQARTDQHDEKGSEHSAILAGQTSGAGHRRQTWDGKGQPSGIRAEVT